MLFVFALIGTVNKLNTAGNRGQPHGERHEAAARTGSALGEGAPGGRFRLEGTAIAKVSAAESLWARSSYDLTGAGSGNLLVFDACD